MAQILIWPNLNVVARWTLINFMISHDFSKNHLGFRALITPLVIDFSREVKSMLSTLSTDLSTTINSVVVIIFGIHPTSYLQSHLLKPSTFDAHTISYSTVHSNFLFCEFVITYCESCNFIFNQLIWGTCTLISFI